MNRKSGYERKDRLSEHLKKIMAETLSRLDDSELELLSITEVEVDNNLSYAKVFVTPIKLDEGKVEGALKALKRNKSTFLNDIASKARIRQLPVLSFQIDEGVKATAKIDEILKELDVSPDPVSGNPSPASRPNPASRNE